MTFQNLEHFDWELTSTVFRVMCHHEFLFLDHSLNYNIISCQCYVQRDEYSCA